MGLFKKLFGDYSSKEIKRIGGLKDKVLALESEFGALSDEQLQAKTPEFKERLEKGETLEECVVRELSEEAGLKVKPIKHLLRVDEYCFETLWVNNYFICEIEGECERHLTESEEYNGVKPVWVDIEKAIEIFGDYESKREDQASLYLREYTVLNKCKI